MDLATRAEACAGCLRRWRLPVVVVLVTAVLVCDLAHVADRWWSGVFVPVIALIWWLPGAETVVRNYREGH